MRLWRRKKQSPLRDAANVIADAVDAAKEQAIADVERELAETRQGARQSHLHLRLAMSRLSTALRIAGNEFSASVRDMSDDLGGRR